MRIFVERSTEIYRKTLKRCENRFAVLRKNAMIVKNMAIFL